MTDINKLSLQVEQLALVAVEIREMLIKQKNDEFLRRIELIEKELKSHGIKLDALNAIDISPTILAPTAPTTVKVATKAQKKEIEDEKVEAHEKVEEKVAEVEEPTSFSNIADYFKYLWVYKRDLIYSKNVYSEEEYTKFMEENKDTAPKKKTNEITLQKSIGFKIWKSLSTERRNIVYAMKDQHTTNIKKKSSTEIVEESEV